MYREPKLPHVLCGLSFCEACHFVRPIPVRLIWAWPEVRLKNVQFFFWVEQVALIFLSSVQLSLLESDEN